MRSIYDAVPVPIARWSMDDNAASAVVVDDIGSHNGTYKDGSGNINTSTGSVPGRINRALDFDGDEYVEVVDHADFSPILTPFSISAWVYMRDASYFILVDKGTGSDDNEYGFFMNYSKQLHFTISDENTANCYIARRYEASLASYENQWIHVVGTYDGGILASGIHLYLNGVLLDAKDISNNEGSFVKVRAGGCNLMIGGNPGITEYANGLIDNLIIHDNELTARQARKLADFRGKESIYGPRQNSIYNTNKNNSIFGGIKEGCTV